MISPQVSLYGSLLGRVWVPPAPGVAPPVVARDLLKLHRNTYPDFWKWSDTALDFAMLSGKLWTAFGWKIHIGADPNPRSLRNFPMQANGAEMLRLACIIATERGIRVCAPVHDAPLIEAPLDEIDTAVAATQEAMAEASSIVLNGFVLRSEAHIVRYPDKIYERQGTRYVGHHPDHSART